MQPKSSYDKTNTYPSNMISRSTILLTAISLLFSPAASAEPADKQPEAGKTVQAERQTEKETSDDKSEKERVTLDPDVVPVQPITPKYAAQILRKIDAIVKERFWCKQLLPQWDAELEHSRADICAAKTDHELQTKVTKLLSSLKSSHCKLFYNHGVPLPSVKELDHPQNYPEAILKSARVDKYPEGSIGYVHLWAVASPESSTAFRTAITDNLRDTDALILDIRNGVGGTADNMYNDLNVLYTPELKVYPPLTLYSGMATIMYHRNGTISVFAPVGSRTLGRYFPKRPEKFVYTKPIVLLTNKHSASMMEIMSYIMKNTGRATLVGETTAGAVLGAQFFDLDKDFTLYLAVSAWEFGHQSLEGVGVAPDIAVASSNEKGKDPQMDKAVEILRAKMSSQAAKSQEQQAAP